MKYNKGQGISISTLVIVALAVFVLFLVIGFVTTGWGFFTGQFDIARQSPEETVRTQCQNEISKWATAGRPDFSGFGQNHHYYKNMCGAQSHLDLGSDYTCCGTIHAPVLSSSECRGAMEICAFMDYEEPIDCSEAEYQTEADCPGDCTWNATTSTCS